VRKREEEEEVEVERVERKSRIGIRSKASDEQASERHLFLLFCFFHPANPPACRSFLQRKLLSRERSQPDLASTMAIGTVESKRRSKAPLLDFQSRVVEKVSSIKPIPSLSLSLHLANNSPGLLAAERHLPRPPARDDEEEESRGSAPLAKDDTDETRLLRRGAAAAVVVAAVFGVALNALPPLLVLAWPPRAATPPPVPLRATVVDEARMVLGGGEREDESLSLSLFVIDKKAKRRRSEVQSRNFFFLFFFVNFSTLFAPLLSLSSFSSIFLFVSFFLKSSSEEAAPGLHVGRRRFLLGPGAGLQAQGDDGDAGAAGGS